MSWAWRSLRIRTTRVCRMCHSPPPLCAIAPPDDDDLLDPPPPRPPADLLLPPPTQKIYIYMYYIIIIKFVEYSVITVRTKESFPTSAVSASHAAAAVAAARCGSEVTRRVRGLERDVSKGNNHRFTRVEGKPVTYNNVRYGLGLGVRMKGRQWKQF